MSAGEILPGLDGAARLPRRALHLAIGMFDGVHLGHRAVIEAAVLSATRSDGMAAALTFNPHPSRLLRPQEPVRLIQSIEARCQRLLESGLGAVIAEPFTTELAAIEAEALLPYIRSRLPQLRAIYVGENWRFGKGRRGDVALLVTEARRIGLNVVSAPRINHNGEPISSTRVRASLETGDIAVANAMLGYSYVASGNVEPGKQLGRTIGFPTLNLPWEPECRPRLGVYAVRVRASTKDRGYTGVANYGVRPTVENVSVPRLEVHLLGKCPFGAGDSIIVEWLEFLRPETRFGNVEALRAQIVRDVSEAARVHQQFAARDE